MDYAIKNKPELDAWFAAGFKLGHSFTAIKGEPPAGMTYSDGGAIVGKVGSGLL